jgi:hypothetical protein
MTGEQIWIEIVADDQLFDYFGHVRAPIYPSVAREFVCLIPPPKDSVGMHTNDLKSSNGSERTMNGSPGFCRRGAALFKRTTELVSAKRVVADQADRVDRSLPGIGGAHNW